MAHVRYSPSSDSEAPLEHGRETRLKPAKGSGRPRGRRATAHIPRRPRQDRAVNTVEAIVGAAANLLVSKGYAASSTNAIAKRAGVSIGSFYQYFANKDAVFRELVERHRREVTPVIAESLRKMADPGSDLAEETVDLIRKMGQVNASDPRLLAAIDRELAWLERAPGNEQRMREAVIGIVRSRLPSHAFSPEVTATLLMTASYSLSRWIVHSKPADLDMEEMLEAFGCMLGGLLSVKGRAPR